MYICTYNTIAVLIHVAQLVFCFRIALLCGQTVWLTCVIAAGAERRVE
jgi:hypothetical protein